MHTPQLARRIGVCWDRERGDTSLWKLVPQKHLLPSSLFLLHSALSCTSSHRLTLGTEQCYQERRSQHQGHRGTLPLLQRAMYTLKMIELLGTCDVVLLIISPMVLWVLFSTLSVNFLHLILLWSNIFWKYWIWPSNTFLYCRTSRIL